MVFDRILEQETILARVDAYSIYSFYIGKELELGTAYVSPLRDDDGIPSFAMYLYKGQIFFKDHALGLSGTVFSFVKALCGYQTMMDAMSRINQDFELELLGGNQNITKTGLKPKLSNGYKVRAKVQSIKVHSIPDTKEMCQFWNDFGILKAVRELYHATQIDIIQYIYNNSVVVVYPAVLTVAYRIYQEYKIYTPHGDKSKKFLNNFLNSYVEGYLQLKRVKNFVIITKAMKEIMFFRSHFDWDSVAGKSENTMIKEFILRKLQLDYKYVFIWLDNDAAGQRAQQAYLKEYPFLIPIHYDVEYKDPTDQYKYSENKREVITEIKQLIYGKTGST